jgi:inosine-uridine nucleoside N-ribohydrolase
MKANKTYEANGNLIALLAALKAIETVASDYPIDSEKQRALKAAQIASLARAAIAKAEPKPHVRKWTPEPDNGAMTAGRNIWSY